MADTLYRIRAHLLCDEIGLDTFIEIEVALNYFPTQAEAVQLLVPAADEQVTSDGCAGHAYLLDVTEITPLGPARAEGESFF